MTETESLRFEKLALLIGQFVGQLAELLNQISQHKLSEKEIYNSLFDLNSAIALHVRELYYKGNTP